jgi:hypothetical protein
MHVASCTWPDVAFAVSYLACLVSSVTTDTFAHVVDVIKYLHVTHLYGLCSGGSSIDCRLCT